MICIVEDLGMVAYGNQGRVKRKAIFECERCHKHSSPVSYSSVKFRGHYKCGACSQTTHGLTYNKDHIRAVAKQWASKNREKVRKSGNKASRKYKAKNKEKIDNYYYLKNYGMTKSEAIEFKKRGCDICGSHNRPVIDHDHATGEIRGVLCDNHNKGLGLLGDTYDDVVIVLEKLKEYLRGK